MVAVLKHVRERQRTLMMGAVADSVDANVPVQAVAACNKALQVARVDAVVVRNAVLPPKPQNPYLSKTAEQKIMFIIN